MKKKLFILLFLVCATNILQAQFISEVLEYKPAPGQFINTAPWGMPDNNNPDVSIVGRLDGAMSLGAFGGYVIFKFANPVENHTDNPYGIDFVVYGNPLKNISNLQVANRVTWAEPGIVSVMKDENKNGLPDDIWYELAGSDYFFSTTVKNYEVTYVNPKIDVATDVPWTDNKGTSGVVLANGFHAQAYYPGASNFPNVNQEKYTLGGTRIADYVDRSNPGFVTSCGRPWGYVDNTLRAHYNGLPDNPYTREKDLDEEGSGGDAFDISWAVDENDEYVDLDEIDFIKVQNAVLGDGGWLGEISTEITGAFDVAPDASVTGISEMIVIKELPDTIEGLSFQIEAFPYKQGRWQKNQTINWSSNLAGAKVDADNQLTFSASGELTLTAKLPNNPQVTTTVSTFLVFDDTATSATQQNLAEIKVYPNPASENIFIEGANGATIEIFSISGYPVFRQQNCANKLAVSIGHLPKGVYVAKINGTKANAVVRFVKK